MSSLAETEAQSDNEPDQRFATAGIAALARPSLIARLFMGVVAFVERLNLKLQQGRQSADLRQRGLPLGRARSRREWRAIRAELERVLTRKDDLPGFHELATDVSTISQDRGWKTFLLAGYGFRSEANIALCPQTWRICQKIPGLITVMFSILEPGKHLPPHRGPYNGVLRLHLGLIVPEPREELGIRVENEVYRWKEGEAVIFDDAYEHEAWNSTPHTRVVLFVDFASRCACRRDFLNWLLLNLAMFTPFIREGMDNQKAWEKKFLRTRPRRCGTIDDAGLLFRLDARSPPSPNAPMPDKTTDPAAPKVSFVSLGCPKALVDSASASSRACARRATSSRASTPAPISSSSTPAASSTAPRRNRSTAIGEALKENGKVIVTGCMGAEPESITAALSAACSRSPARSNTRAWSRPCTARCRRRTIRSSTWCRRKASS